MNTEAASKKKMYVVTKISSGNKVFVPNTKVSYTSDGLISKTDTDNKWDRRICSYNYTNGKATSGTEKWGWKGTPIKKVMTYKNGHLNRITIKENGAEEQYCYIWKKGKCIRVDSNYRDSEGESSYQKGLYEYKYNKKGLIVFERTPATFRYKYDKKKNIKSYTLASADEERRDFHFKNKYKKGLLKKAKVTGKLGYDKKRKN